MPYTKRRRSKYRRRRPLNKRRRYSRRRLNKTIKRVVSGMSETKFITTAINGSVDSTSIAYYKCFPPAGIPQGVGESQRIGNSVTTKFNRFRFAIALTKGTSPPASDPTKIRCIIGRFRQAPLTQGTPVMTDFMDLGPTPVSNGNCNVQINNKLFKAYYDKTTRLDFLGTYNLNGYRAYWDIKTDIKWVKKWSFRADGSIADNDDLDSLWIFVLSENTSANQCNMVVGGYYRVSYLDL